VIEVIIEQIAKPLSKSHLGLENMDDFTGFYSQTLSKGRGSIWINGVQIGC
jgi:hypothetical protein